MERENSLNALPPGPHPAIAAVLLAAGACVMLAYGFYLLDDIPDTPVRQEKMNLRIIGGFVLWIAGCSVLARCRQASAWLGAVCGVFLLPGLAALLIFTRNARAKRLKALKDEFLLDRRHRARHVRPLY